MTLSMLTMDTNKAFKAVCVTYFATFIYICDGLVFETDKNMSGNNIAELTTKSFTRTNEIGKIKTESPDFQFKFTPPIVTRYGLNSDECIRKTSCDGVIELEGRTCFCDSLCPIFNDCCENVVNTTIMKSKNVPGMHQFDCLKLTLRNFKVIESHVVTKCSSEWNDTFSRNLCENVKDDPNIVFKVPVIDRKNFIYRNMYCAYCNFQFDFDFWIVEERCPSQNDNSQCKLFYDPPVNHSLPTSCRTFDFVSTCSLVGNSTEENSQCELSPTNIVYTFTSGGEFTKYKNKYCALCNNEDEDLLLCNTGIYEGDGPIVFHPPGYSFRVLVDLNTMGNGNAIEFHCKNDQIYDPISKNCRKIFCPPTTIIINGRCIPEVRTLKQETDENTTSCAFIKLKSNEWSSENETGIYVPALDKVFNSSMFYFNGTDVYLCADMFENQPGSTDIFTFNSAESYVTICGLIFSISALTVTLIIYCMFIELRNIPGKILICLIISLLSAQTSFLFISHAAGYSITCKSLAIIVHYFYTSSFTWMNVIAFDLLLTFSRSFIVTGGNKTSKRFFLYNVYGWLLPMIIVATAVGIDESSFDTLSEFRPGYGQGICWITSTKALMLFFIGPLAFFKLIDIIGFIFTSCFIARARQQGSRANNNGKLCSFFLYIKLSAVMGLTWVFAFLATFTNNTVIWYMFIIFNTLQGVFIAASFLCSRKVFKLVRNKISKGKHAPLTTTLSTSRG
ncbi:adhesion G protein-coupled receptor E3-like [Ruditapes philippinarum]|uniref:adhesion G protein-coupled receptor E3-like n=1 Tax=Ruditapes philippinarum TaxID=129788 RepID=UPI00295A93BC|nr:adhesion G protein-coupled receptor E3-like [Ruditapes philippinarum]